MPSRMPGMPEDQDLCICCLTSFWVGEGVEGGLCPACERGFENARKGLHSHDFKDEQHE